VASLARSNTCPVLFVSSYSRPISPRLPTLFPAVCCLPKQSRSDLLHPKSTLPERSSFADRTKLQPSGSRPVHQHCATHPPQDAQTVISELMPSGFKHPAITIMGTGLVYLSSTNPAAFHQLECMCLDFSTSNHAQ
jgi:hypothetical protein